MAERVLTLLEHTAALKYLVSDLKESGGPREIAIDPLIGSIGIGYRF